MSREPPPIAPRRLTAEQAAAYLGYATTAVLANIPVKPRKLCETGPGSQPKYDRLELDAWLDRLAGLRSPAVQGEGGAAPQDDAAEAYDTWKATRGAG